MSDSTPRHSQATERRFEKGKAFCNLEWQDQSIRIESGQNGLNVEVETHEFVSANLAFEEFRRHVRSLKRDGFRDVSKVRRAPRESGTNAASADSFHAHQPFLEALQDDPWEHHNFGVYADWLIENGDVRGELIQIELQLENPRLADSQRQQLSQQAQKLTAAHIHHWLGELSGYLIDTRRNPIRRNSFRLWRGALLELNISRFRAGFARCLCDSPWRPLLYRLEIDHVIHRRTQLHRNHPFIVAGSQPLPALRQLRFGKRNHRPPLGEWLSYILRRAPNLETLELNGMVRLRAIFGLRLPKLKNLAIACPIDELTMRHLIESDRLASLSILDLSACEMNDEVIQILGRSNDLPKLAELRIGESALSRRGRRALEAAGAQLVVVPAT